MPVMWTRKLLSLINLTALTNQVNNLELSNQRETHWLQYLPHIHPFRNSWKCLQLLYNQLQTILSWVEDCNILVSKTPHNHLVCIPSGNCNIAEEVDNTQGCQSPVPVVNTTSVQVVDNPSAPTLTRRTRHNLQNGCAQKMTDSRVTCVKSSANTGHVIGSLVIEKLDLT